MTKPTILITNDDGIFSPGILHLSQALSDHFDIYIIAPSNERSGAGLSITLNRPLDITPVAWEGNIKAFKVNGTPADCVKLALNVILPTFPALIVSGINNGANSGRNVLYSGTVGGVIEGTMRGVPGIAFSCVEFNPSYEETTKYILPIVNYFLKSPPPSGTLINVSFPSHHLGTVKGIKLARQGKSYWTDNPQKRTHPHSNNPYYWIGGKWEQYEEKHDTDIALLEEGYITAVPIYIHELTNHKHLEENQETFGNFFSSHFEIEKELLP